MAPKKKGRVPSRAPSTSSGGAPESTPTESPVEAEAKATNNSNKSDAWTDEQEISLFKAMIRWKPVGMHKHFRMIAISEHLKNHGYNGYSSSYNAHTQIPGIWKKLGELYNLEVLDLREDNVENVNGKEVEEALCEFKLPDEGYSEISFARRLAAEGSSSPPSLGYQLSPLSLGGGRVGRRYSTVDDTDDPRSSPASARGTPSGRSTRASRSIRGSRLAEVSVPGGKPKSTASPYQGAEDEERDDQGDENAVDEDDGESKAVAQKNKGKISRGAAAKNSTRRSGRKR